MDISSFSNGSKLALDDHLRASLLERATDAILVRGPSGTIIFWNQGAEQIYGWSAQEAMRRIVHDLLQTRFPESYEAVERLLSREGQWSGELVQTCKDGTQVIVESRQVLMRDEQNMPLAIMEINRDITERKQADEVHLQFAALVESAAIPIIGKKLDGTISSWNRAAERMYGYSAREAIGQPITLISPPGREEEFERIMEQVRRGEQADIYETVRQGKDGVLHPVAVTVSPVLDGEGRPIGASSITYNITERKRSEAQEQFLTRVSKELASTLDYQETLSNIARLVVPQLADWFAVDLVDEKGNFELVELAHRDPEQVSWARTLRERYPVDPNAQAGTPRVVRTGQSELYSVITDEQMVAAAKNAEELALARRIGYSSVMLVPLVARGKTIGVVSFVATESGKHYDERDLALAEEIGRRAGVALDNAWFYREIRHSRDQLSIILQGVADGIIVYAQDSQIVYANEAAAHSSGYASVEQMLAVQQSGLLQKYELIDERGKPFPHSHLTHTRVLAGEAEAQAIIGHREIGGELPERWSIVKSRPVIGEGGDVALVITITHDVTERMKTERRKDEFLSMTSHELKTPVTSLKGFTYVLQRRLTRQGDTQGLHYLARMDAQLDRLTTLISDLLDISRMQSGKLALRVEAVELDALIDETVENVQATTTSHQLIIEGRTGAQVMGDKDRLGQVIVNLLNNAIKYSPRAQEVIVHLVLDGEGRRIIVSVQDFGIGIDQVHHEKVFERFYQVSGAEEKTYPGLGIGLSICGEIVARHQGKMWVESRKGEGATFFVALPLLEANSNVAQA